MAFQDREADGLQRLAQLGRERAAIRLAPPQEPAEVTGPDGVVLVEGFRAVGRLGQMVGLALLDLVVTDKLPVGGAHPVRPPVLHAWPSPRPTA